MAQRLYVKGVESVQNYLDSIEKNIKNRDTNELAEDYHALKGVLANLGLKEYFQMSNDLEQTCKRWKLYANHQI